MAGSPETEAPEKDATPNIVVQPAQNGGFVVYDDGSPDCHLLGAFSSGAELMRGLPDILGLDGLSVEVFQKSALGTEIQRDRDELAYSQRLTPPVTAEQIDDGFVKAWPDPQDPQEANARRERI